jgi:hypothetical protein
MLGPQHHTISREKTKTIPYEHKPAKFTNFTPFTVFFKDFSGFYGSVPTLRTDTPLNKVGKAPPVHFKINFLNQILKSKIDKNPLTNAQLHGKSFAVLFIGISLQVVIRKLISNLSDFLF